jgi:hypothetical protein
MLEQVFPVVLIPSNLFNKYTIKIKQRAATACYYSAAYLFPPVTMTFYFELNMRVMYTDQMD